MSENFNSGGEGGRDDKNKGNEKIPNLPNYCNRFFGILRKKILKLIGDSCELDVCRKKEEKLTYLGESGTFPDNGHMEILEEFKGRILKLKIGNNIVDVEKYGLYFYDFVKTSKEIRRYDDYLYIISFEDTDEVGYMYNKGGQFKLLSVDGKKSFNGCVNLFMVNNYTKTPISGYIENRENGKVKYFYKNDDGDYTLLVVKGIREFNEIEVISALPNGKPLYGATVVSDLKKFRIFYRTTDKRNGRKIYKFVELKGINDFDMIVGIKKSSLGELISGKVFVNDEIINFVINSDGECQFSLLQRFKNLLLNN